MPIKVQSDLPVRAILEKENIFVMDETRAMNQDIRPLKIGILNLMPLKEDTELQLLRSLSNTPLQLDITFLTVSTHESKNTAQSHINKFYEPFCNVKKRRFDGLIITGAPVEQMEFEEVDYWEELVEIMDWAQTHVTSTFFICWGAQAAMYHYYGLKKKLLSQKLFGLYRHQIQNRKEPLIRGFDDEFLAPHSRHTTVDAEEIRACKDLTILAESKEAGVFISMAEEGRKIFVFGHPEYDRHTLEKEYVRDKEKGLDIQIPRDYFKDNDSNNPPLLMWRAHANTLYTNWINYYVYQLTPYMWEDEEEGTN